MKDKNDQETFADYINCLSILENETAQLYQTLSSRTETPLAKNLLLQISLDSRKHSKLLGGMRDSFAPSRSRNTKDCSKNLGKVWLLMNILRNEVANQPSESRLTAVQLMDKLTNLESALGEEYHMFIQMKNLEVLSKKIKELYGVEPRAIRVIIEGIIRDEDRHAEILSTIKQILNESQERKVDNTPMVRFQSPDAWAQAPK